MPAAATPLAALDPISPQHYAAGGYPHTEWARLRREAPVFRVELPGFDPFWAITKHADVVGISKQPERFLNAPRLSMMHNSVRPPPEELADPKRKQLLRMLLNMDNPDHRDYRKLVKGWFTPRSLQRLEPRIAAMAGRLLDRMAHEGGPRQCDFVAEVAARLPLAVIAAILGVPEADEDLVLELSNQGIGAQDPEFQKQGLSARESRRQALLRLFSYFSELAEDRRASPRDDLATVLANARLGGEYLPMRELLSYFGLIAVAGHETTRNAISGGLAAFLEHPEQWRRLREDPSRVGLAAEEIVRFTSPVIQFCRTAAEDVELRGQKIRAGDVLVLFYPSANRDDEVFEAADEFRIDRSPNPHLGFGIGEHFCLGANLARLELRVLFRQLAERLEEAELLAPPSYLASSFVGGIKHLRLRARVRPAARSRAVL
jgi:cytochrome P450